MFKQQLKTLAIVIIILGVLGVFLGLTNSSMAQFAPSQQQNNHLAE